MRDSVERIQNKGNSSLLLQLAERVENAAEIRSPQPFRSQPVNQPSLNVVEMSTVSRAVTDVRDGVLEIKTVKDFFKMNARAAVIEMESGLCNDSAIKVWNLSVFSKLRELVVGDDCIQFVKGLKLVGFVRLERVAIGGGCCVKWSSFVLKNCDSIQEVSIGDGCFVSCENTVFESEI